MDEDDPDTLDAFVQYLHTSGTMHIQNWRLWWDSCVETWDGEFLTTNGLCKLPPGYLPFLANVLVLADKYEQPLLAEAVATMFDLPPEDKDCGSTEARIGELYNAYVNAPMDALRALGILSQLPGECLPKWQAEHYLLSVFGDGNFISFSRYSRPKFDGGPSMTVKSELEMRESLASIMDDAPGIFSTMAGHYQDLLGSMSNMEKKFDSERKELQREFDNERRQLRMEITRLKHGSSMAQQEITRLWASNISLGDEVRRRRREAEAEPDADD